MKEDKVSKEANMLESGEYDRKIKQEEILARARAKQNKLKSIRQSNRPEGETYPATSPESKKKKELTIGLN